MATRKQLDANRANARKSTGPKSAAGKAVAARNARKHAIFGRDVAHVHEDPAQFDALVEGLRADLKPRSMLEDELIDQLALAFWRNRRLARAERLELNGAMPGSLVINTGVRRTEADEPDQTKPTELALTGRSPDEMIASERVQLLGRYQVMITNEIRRTLAMLYEAQERRVNAIEAAASTPQSDDGQIG